MAEEDLELNEKYLERNYSDSCLESINNALSTPLMKKLEEDNKLSDKLKQVSEQENLNFRKKIYDEQGWMIKFTEAFDSMLCSNLIINKDSNMLILKPFHGWQIVNCLRNAPNNVKNEIIEKLNWLIGKLHINSYILTNKSSLRNFKTDINFNFVLELIEILIENNRDYLLSEKILKLIGKIVFYSGLKSRYIKYILKKILNLFTIYDGNIFILLIKLLNIIFGKTIHDGKNFPERYFYFNNFNSDLKVKTETLQINNITLAKVLYI